MKFTQPSSQTSGLWGVKARHAIRFELIISFFCLFSLPFAIAQSAINPVTALWNLPAPLVTLVFSCAAIFCFTRRTLHPVYTLCIAIFLFLGWIADQWIVLLMDSFAVQLEDGNWNEGNQEDYGGQPMIGVVVVKDLCFMVVTVAYFVYVCFSANAVDAHRKRQRQGVIELVEDDRIELVAADGTKLGKN